MGFPLVITSSQSSGSTNLKVILSHFPGAHMSPVEDGVLRMALIWFASCRGKPGLLRSCRFQEYASTVMVQKGRAQHYKRLLAVIDEYQQSELFWERAETDDVDGCIRDILSRYYLSEDCLFWGDKYPEYLFFLNEIQRILPDVRYIFLIRHPYYVARSIYVTRTREMKLKDLNEPRRGMQDCVDQWVIWNRYLKDYLEQEEHENYLLLRYEQMLLEPEACMEMTGAFLGVKLSSAPAVVEGFKQTRNTVRDKSDSFYRPITDCYTDELRGMADYFGYDPYDPALQLG